VDLIGELLHQFKVVGHAFLLEGPKNAVIEALQRVVVD